MSEYIIPDYDLNPTDPREKQLLKLYPHTKIDILSSPPNLKEYPVLLHFSEFQDDDRITGIWLDYDKVDECIKTLEALPLVTTIGISAQSFQSLHLAYLSSFLDIHTIIIHSRSISEIQDIPEIISQLSKFKNLLKLVWYNCLNILPRDFLELSTLNHFVIDGYFTDLGWIRNYRARFSKYMDLNLKGLNVFIGRNSSGKTYTLNSIYRSILSEPQVSISTYNHEFLTIVGENRFRAFNEFFLPHVRTFERAHAKRTDITDSFVELITTLRSIKFPDYSPLQNNQPWTIPNLTKILEILNWNDSKSLANRIRKIAPVLTIFKKIFENFSIILQRMFPDVQLIKPERDDQTGEITLKLNDAYNPTNRHPANLEAYGSGVQQLFSIILLIEFLRLSPNLYYDRWSLHPPKDLQSIEKDQYYSKDPINTLLFIDEPEISLHPEVQRKFFDYLHDASITIQIFIGTHSTALARLDDDVSVYLLRKVKGEGFKQPLEITHDNECFIRDELFDDTPLDAAIYLSQEPNPKIGNPRFQDIKNELHMVEKIRKEIHTNLKGRLMDLGTINEDPYDRILWNAYLMAQNVEKVDLRKNIDETVEIGNIYSFGIHKLKSNPPPNLRLQELKKECWSDTEEQILHYTPENRMRIREIIKNEFYLRTSDPTFQLKNSIVVFPECSLPYDMLEELIGLSLASQCVIVGGMEHEKKQIIIEKVHNLPKNCLSKGSLLDLPDSLDDNALINQAVIINRGESFAFQIKNFPFQDEDIRVLLPPVLRIFSTNHGNIAVMVCKDFLVNHSVIPLWMKKNNVKMIIIPSLTKRIKPFVYKLGNIIENRFNDEFHFVFVNIAEFGQSGYYSFQNRNEKEKICIDDGTFGLRLLYSPNIAPR